MLLSIIIKSIIIYFLVMVVIKFMGKREIGQLSIFDFTVLLIIADILVSGISQDYTVFFYYMLAIIAISLIQKILAFVMLKKGKLRDLIEGRNSNIIINGKLQIKEMQKQNYNISDLLVQLRLKNIRSLSEVKYAILETNGELSVFKNSDFSSDNRQFNSSSKAFDAISGNKNSEAYSESDSGIYPFPLIISGNVQYENLKIVNVKEKWLFKELEKRNLQLEDILFANYENQELFIVKGKDS